VFVLGVYLLARQGVALADSDACKPAKAVPPPCEAAKRVPVCEPAKPVLPPCEPARRVEVCKPVKPLPPPCEPVKVCGPVTTCEQGCEKQHPIADSIHHAAYVLTSHLRNAFGARYETYEYQTTPATTSPSETAPSPSSQPPAPPKAPEPPTAEKA